jgi:hypothetical protein
MYWDGTYVFLQQAVRIHGELGGIAILQAKFVKQLLDISLLMHKYPIGFIFYLCA